MTYFTRDLLQIQVDFEKAIYISTGETADTLNVTFNLVDWFKKSDNKSVTVKPFSSIYKNIPSLLPNSRGQKVFG